MDTMLWSHVLSGAILLGYAVTGLFFLRFWSRTRDRLFAIFAVAFWILMIERCLLLGTAESQEFLPYVYLVRLAAFLLIILAVLDKNRTPPR